MGAIYDEQPKIGRRHDRRGSGLPIDQAHLAKKVTRLLLAPSPDRSSHRRHAVDDRASVCLICLVRIMERASDQWVVGRTP